MTRGDVDAYWAQRRALLDWMNQHLHEVGSRSRSGPLPVRLGRFSYGRDTSAGQYAVHVRWVQDGTRQVVLDENEIAGDGYFALGCFLVSPDARLVAYTADRTGGERYRLHVRDIGTGEELAVRAGAGRAVAWATDSRGLCYPELDHLGRPASVRWLDLPSGTDELVLSEPDEDRELDVALSKSTRWLFVTSIGPDDTVVWAAPAARPARLEPLLPGNWGGGNSYPVHADGQEVLVLTERADRGQVVAVRPGHPAAPRVVLAPDDKARIEEIDAVRHYLIARISLGLASELRVIDLRTGEARTIEPPAAPAELMLAANPEAGAASYRYCYTSLATPRTFGEFRLSDGRSSFSQSDAPQGYRQGDYVEERLEARSADGTLVPLAVLRRRDHAADGTAPGLLVAYGAYGLDVGFEFLPFRQVLLDLGFVFAIGCVRGGGAYGPGWHQAGRGVNKPNGIADLIACARHLSECGLVAADRLTGRGFSAAGVLFGAAMNECPGLFAGVALHAPLVDVMGGLKTADGSLIAGECAEWGDPSEPADVRVIRGYSPAANVRRQPYPGIWATVTTDDPRVSWQDVVRWAEQVRQASTSGRPVLVRLTEGGHTGPSGRAVGHELAQALAFLCDLAGVKAGELAGFR